MNLFNIFNSDEAECGEHDMQTVKTGHIFYYRNRLTLDSDSGDLYVLMREQKKEKCRECGKTNWKTLGIKRTHLQVSEVEEL